MTREQCQARLDRALLELDSWHDVLLASEQRETAVEEIAAHAAVAQTMLAALTLDSSTHVLESSHAGKVPIITVSK